MARSGWFVYSDAGRRLSQAVCSAVWRRVSGVAARPRRPALLQLSIFALGIMPYITASVIIQLLRVVIPDSAACTRKDRRDRQKLTQYTRAT